ncbi:hypothetical protein GGR56DRAFT_669731 [Xylariaceae sp. FL0804]|nr:hypothetical protein GGR56DRAFT_669731 [Xylariaceae sp. FL0804]
MPEQLMDDDCFTADGRTRFLDWSAYYFGLCFHGLVYFVASMLTVEDRRAREWEVFGHYLAALRRLDGPELDCEDEELLVEYRQSPMANVIWTIRPDGLQSKEGLNVCCEWSAASWVDHKTIDSGESQ